MTTTDPTREQVRVEKYARALHDGANYERPVLGYDQQSESWRDELRTLVRAILPLVAAEVVAAEQRGAAEAAERIAQAIETAIPDMHDEHQQCDDCWAMRHAAHLARNGGTDAR